MIAGLGGHYYVMDYANGVWSNDAFGDRGWLAIALVIFTIWRPNVSIVASILFGGLYILYLFIPTGTDLAVKELYKMLPYVVTIVVLVFTSMRNKRESQPPGKPRPAVLPRRSLALGSVGLPTEGPHGYSRFARYYASFLPMGAVPVVWPLKRRSRPYLTASSPKRSRRASVSFAREAWSR